MSLTRRGLLAATSTASVALAAASQVTEAQAADAPTGPVPMPAAPVAAGPMADMPRGMVLATLRTGSGFNLAVRTAKGVMDVPRAAAILGMPAPFTMNDVMRGGHNTTLQHLVAAALASPKAASAFVPEAEAKFGPCVTDPEKILCVGYNYRPHAKEAGAAIPTTPILFNKFNNSLNWHRGDIKLPTKVSTKFDYEIELVIVIGREAVDVPEERALDYVLGYATGNDFSSRDLQFATSQFMLGKSSDGYAPLGPWLVGADMVPDPDSLNLECRVNGQVRQSSNTRELIFGCKTLISFCSRHFTLKPGDIIFTGTPEGVILGMPKDKQVWLKAGDQIACSVEHLGELTFGLV
jgi:2-keto-4-pentenoate hydratase/2-oxohepta-3-ene-1,7-dioic acid hydratase in catechol pathway